MTLLSRKQNKTLSKIRPIIKERKQRLLKIKRRKDRKIRFCLLISLSSQCHFNPLVLTSSNCNSTLKFSPIKIPIPTLQTSHFYISKISQFLKGEEEREEESPPPTIKTTKERKKKKKKETIILTVRSFYVVCV